MTHIACLAGVLPDRTMGLTLDTGYVVVADGDQFQYENASQGNNISKASWELSPGETFTTHHMLVEPTAGGTDFNATGQQPRLITVPCQQRKVDL